VKWTEVFIAWGRNHRTHCFIPYSHHEKIKMEMLSTNFTGFVVTFFLMLSKCGPPKQNAGAQKIKSLVEN
jgi:hypothetical protein